MLGGLVARLGVTIEREVELISFTQDATGVDATLRHADGHEEVVRTPYLLGFDGARSTIRHALGIDFTGKSLPGWCGEPARLHDVLRGRHHVLLALGGDDAGVAARVAERYGDRVRPLVVGGGSLRGPDGTLQRRYNADHPVLYLVRPDGYIGFLSRPADGDALLGYLDDLFGGAR